VLPSFSKDLMMDKVGTILRVKAPQLSVRNFSDVVGVRPMEDDAPKALIVRPTSGLQQHDSGAEKVLSRIVSDALTIARGRDIADTSPRIQIGKYEFREQDYRQIVIWAEATDASPVELIHILEEETNTFPDGSSFEVSDGKIIHVIFPERIAFKPERLVFKNRKIIISHVPNLEKIGCGWNHLTEIDLSNVPALTSLTCDGNQLTELDLSNVPALTNLECSLNALTELNLSNVPALTILDCGENQLTELDVSNVPELTDLQCYYNELTELNLSNVPALTSLTCDGNQLTELDLSNLPALTHLYCEKTQLTELDLSNVPELTLL
jgi:Leucine-rich repeat (LRR) protein